MPDVGRGALLILVAALRPRCGPLRLCVEMSSWNSKSKFQRKDAKDRKARKGEITISFQHPRLASNIPLDLAGGEPALPGGPA
jgi:hypothetical protein